MYEILRPISLLYVDTKVISIAPVEKLKGRLPSIFSQTKTVHVKNCFTIESSRLIDDIIDIYDEKYPCLHGNQVFWKSVWCLRSRILEMILGMICRMGKSVTNYQEPHVLLNSGIATQYFKLQKAAHQGRLLSPYMFILALEVIFVLIKMHKLDVFDIVFALFCSWLMQVT